MVLKHTLENAKAFSSLRLEVDTVTTAEAMLELFHRPEGTVGSDAVSAIRQSWNYEFVIVDESLEAAGGVMLGSDAVRELKRQGCLSKMIMCSCYCSEKDRQKYTDAGADMVWPKYVSRLSACRSCARALHAFGCSSPNPRLPTRNKRTQAVPTDRRYEVEHSIPATAARGQRAEPHADTGRGGR